MSRGQHASGTFSSGKSSFNLLSFRRLLVRIAELTTRFSYLRDRMTFPSTVRYSHLSLNPIDQEYLSIVRILFFTPGCAVYPPGLVPERLFPDLTIVSFYFCLRLFSGFRPLNACRSLDGCLPTPILVGGSIMTIEKYLSYSK